MNGRSQAVRLPAEFRFEGKEVYIERQGDTVILRPKPESLGQWLEDFYVDRLRQSYGHLENLRACKSDLTKLEDLRAATQGRELDSVICLNVVEHIEDDVKVLRNFHDILKPGGRALVLVPHDPTNFTDVDKTLGHFRRYTREELSAKAEEAGFIVKKCFGFNRVGGLGWRVSGKILRKKTLSVGRCKPLSF